MRFFALSTMTLAFAGAATALTIPADLLEGFYVATADEAGNHNFTLISSTRPADNPGDVDLAKRSTTWPYKTNPQCANAQWLPQGDFYNGAWNSFYDQCANLGGTKIGNNQKIFSYWGNAVAFMCSYSSGGNPCSTSEWHDAVDWVANSCSGRDGGYMQPGWLSIPGWKKSYGYANSASSFC